MGPMFVQFRVFQILSCQKEWVGFLELMSHGFVVIEQKQIEITKDLNFQAYNMMDILGKSNLSAQLKDFDLGLDQDIYKQIRHR